jgi:HD-like signal output (HDOD) protein
LHRIDLTPEGLVAGIKDLVTLPEVALRIAQMAEDSTSSAAEIGREIGKDPALNARVLQVANSPAFGHIGKIGTITRAIAVIGLRQVRDLTVALTAMRSFEGIGNELVSMESFWRQSVLCAVAAGQIAERRAGGVAAESPFIAGLLHDIGQLVIYSRVPDLGRRALLRSIDAIDDTGLFLCERELMGFDHGAVGAALARRWGLPRSLQECIEFHHEPLRARDYPVDVATVHVANSVAVLAEIGSTDREDAPPIAPAALHSVGADLKDLPALVRKTGRSASELLSLLGAGDRPLRPRAAERIA